VPSALVMVVGVGLTRIKATCKGPWVLVTRPRLCGSGMGNASANVIDKFRKGKGRNQRQVQGKGVTFMPEIDDWLLCRVKGLRVTVVYWRSTLARNQISTIANGTFAELTALQVLYAEGMGGAVDWTGEVCC
jgi:hypothetical protein